MLKKDLNKYCTKKEYNYQTILSIIENVEKTFPSLPEEEIIKRSIKQYNNTELFKKAQKEREELLDKEITEEKDAKRACKLLQIDFSTVEILKEKGFTYTEAIHKMNQLSDKYNGRKENKSNYILNKLIDEKNKDKPKIDLKKYCEENDYDYVLLNRIHNAVHNQEKGIDNYKILERTIQIAETKKYKAKSDENVNNRNLNLLNSINQKNDVISKCRELKIDYKNAYNLFLREKSWSFANAANIVWYFHDLIDSKRNKHISLIKVTKVKVLIDKIKNNEISIDDISLYDLIGIYKTGLCDTREMVLLKETNYINNLIDSVAPEIEKSEITKEECTKKIQNIILENIDKTSVNKEEKLYKRLDLKIKNDFATFINNYKSLSVTLKDKEKEKK